MGPMQADLPHSTHRVATEFWVGFWTLLATPRITFQIHSHYWADYLLSKHSSQNNVPCRSALE